MIQKSKPETPIEEIHRTRREISDRFSGDIVAIAEDAARRQALSNRRVWQPCISIKDVRTNIDGSKSGDENSIPSGG